jgi:hypothetical protein
VVNARFLRVVSFKPAARDSPLDAALRDAIVPAVLERPDVVDAWIGRNGAHADQTRVLASTWSADPGPAPADLAALTGPALVHAAIEILAVEHLELAVHARFDRPDPARILRVFRGHVWSGELDAYVEEARTGMLADAAVNDGLIAFALGVDAKDSFLTVSAWTGWAAIESATGGNVRRPFSTRNTARLDGFTVGHFEILPETPDRGVAASGRSSAART